MLTIPFGDQEPQNTGSRTASRISASEGPRTSTTMEGEASSEPLRVWLVTIGEPVPFDESRRDRLHRTGYFARFLAKKGHNVVWWTSSFDHFLKKHVVPTADATVTTREGVTIRALRGTGYKRNVSIRRFVDHRLIAHKFSKAAEREVPPDVIVCALPTVELCAESVRYGLNHSVPVVLDMRDMWPDIFVTAIPSPLRAVGRIALHGMFSAARFALAGATAIIGITEPFVDWGLERGRRRRSQLDVAFPLTHEALSLGEGELRAAAEHWRARGVSPQPDVVTLCYMGAIGHQLDLAHIIHAARILHEARGPFRFVICGVGDCLGDCREAARGLPNVVLPGWVGAAEMQSLMQMSSAGLNPLPMRRDFLNTINNKAVEYLSAGLPIIATPQTGLLAELLINEECGLTYRCEDAAGLVSLLRGVAAMPEDLTRLARNAARVFASRFDANRVSGSMEAHLRCVIKRTSGVGSEK